MALNGKAGKWFKNLFKGPSMPHAPTASELYGGPRAFSDYRPEAANAGGAALGALNQIARTGWSPTDMAAQAQAQTQANRNEQAQRGAVMQDARARGMGGGGLQFSGALAAQQGGANAAAQAGAGLAMAGADRRLGAASAAGDLEMQRASSTDQFNQWASGQQTAATMGAYEGAMSQYEAKAAKRKQMLDRITGGISGLTSVIQSRRGGD
jgi:hypothetical protein